MLSRNGARRAAVSDMLLAMALLRRMAKKLKALRAERGWSQVDLAARAGISRVHLARIETERLEPTLGVIERLAKALKVKAGALLE